YSRSCRATLPTLRSGARRAPGWGPLLRARSARSLSSLLPQLDDGFADADRGAQPNRCGCRQPGPVQVGAVGGAQVLDDPLTVAVRVDPGMTAGGVVVVQHDRAVVRPAQSDGLALEGDCGA